jgi:RHS repeat-associated protein
MMATNAVSYLYNGLGQMVEKSGSGSTTTLMYDESGHLMGEYDGGGNLIDETVWLGDVPVATLQPNGSGGVNIFYVHTDQLNSPRKVSRPSDNQLTWRWDTDPFGTASPNSNPAGLGTFTYNLRFPGQYYQTETGLNYNYFRDYDPQVGKYVESDLIGLQGGINTYAYVGSNPLPYVDPWGLAQCTYSIAEHSITCVSNDGQSAVTSSQGISYGLGTCKNNNSCSSLKMLGPVTPDTYNVNANTLPGRQGWWALQSSSWNPGVDGLLCRLGFKRCGFNLHIGTISEGCITFDKNDPAATDAFNKISNLFSADSPNNTLTVITNLPKPSGSPHP